MSVNTAADRVCWMLWNSLLGWQNRPDYFDKNDFMLLGDLAYRANVDGETLGPILAELKTESTYELSCGLQRVGEYDKLWDYLVSVDAGPIPLMCNLDHYGKWRK